MAEKKVLLIGDVHGKIGGYFDVLNDFIQQYSRTDENYTLQLGDFGFGDTYQQRENRIERGHRYDADKHVFFGGNHDDYDKYEDVTGSLGHFGEIPFIDESFFVRGAESLDKDARTVGYDWWKEEELDWRQSNEAIEQYIEVEPKHVFTHDAPHSAADQIFPEKTNFGTHTSHLLQQMLESHRPDTWTFGHWHKTRSMELSGTTFQCLGELDTKEMIFDG